MPNISEMLFIFVLALILIGPKQLPEVARNVGRFLNEMKRASEGLFNEFKKPQNQTKSYVANLKKDVFESPAATPPATPKNEATHDTKKDQPV